MKKCIIYGCCKSLGRNLRLLTNLVELYPHNFVISLIVSQNLLISGLISQFLNLRFYTCKIILNSLNNAVVANYSTLCKVELNKGKKLLVTSEVIVQLKNQLKIGCFTAYYSI